MSNQGNSKNWLYLGIIAALAAACAYLFISKNKQEDKTHEVTTQLADVSSSKQALQDDFNAALQRIDEMKSSNKSMDSLLLSKDGEIKDLLNQIKAIQSKENATAEELAKGRSLIASLQGKLDGYQKQIEELKKANAQLATEKQQISAEKDRVTEEKQNVEKQNTQLSNEKANLEQNNANLSSKVDLAKVLHAGNIKLEPVKKQWLTGKEVNTEKAKRTKVMRISFDLDDNRLAESGEKQIYIVVYGPDGAAYKRGTFNLSDGTQKAFTTTKTVSYTQGKATKDIGYDWTPEGKFDAGDYTVEIYHQGYKIGERVVTLK
ncbi:MAG: hypothetical protein RL660_301 [Bacteroidota bacterium]|jgi:DNA repair exonuclease SbcCD ATPase subunit